MGFERPKIVFNPKTKMFVMWYHHVGFPGDHGHNPGEGEAGNASSPSIKGPFTFHGTTRPIQGTDQIIFLAERHQTQSMTACSAIWLPVDFPMPDRITIRYLERWTL